MILARLAPGNDHVKAETQEHLDVSTHNFKHTSSCNLMINRPLFQSWVKYFQNFRFKKDLRYMYALDG